MSIQRRVLSRLPVIALVLVSVLSVQARSSACPLCREAVATDEAADGTGFDASRTGRAYGLSILIMLCMPLALIAGGALALLGVYKRNLARLEASAHVLPETGHGDRSKEASANRSRETDV